MCRKRFWALPPSDGGGFRLVASLIPSMDMSASMGRLVFIPACGGLLIGMLSCFHGLRDPSPSHGR